MQKAPHICKECENPYRLTRQWVNPAFCSKLCANNNRWKRTMVNLTCAECGVRFSRKRCLVTRPYRTHGENYFCGRVCHGKFTARNDGFAGHPENTGRRKGITKYESLMPQAIELAKEGKGLSNIARTLGIPIPSLSSSPIRQRIAPYLQKPIRVQKPHSARIPKPERLTPKRKWSRISDNLPKVLELAKQGKSIWAITQELHIGHSALDKYKEQILEAHLAPL